MAHYKSTVIRSRPEPSSDRKGDRDDIQRSNEGRKRDRHRMGTAADFVDSLVKNSLTARLYRKVRKNLAYDPR
jgi:hypothetical protein